MDKLLSRVRQYMESRDMLQPGDAVLTALSGGADSVFLLTLLLRLREEYGITLAAAHLHHGLRGAAADEDQQFCMELCSREGIDFFAKHADVRAEAQEARQSVEEAGRFARYRFFEETAEKHGFTKIATGHHKDDSAESVLLHLVSGAGLKGLTGIEPVRGSIIRPLLPVTKSEIIESLDSERISYRTDHTNADASFKRNALRHKVLPVIREHLNPNVVGAVSRFAELNTSLYEFLNERFIIPEIRRLTAEGGYVRIPLTLLAAYPAYLSGEIIRSAAGQFGRQLNFSDVEQCLHLAALQKGKRHSLSGGLEAVREQDAIVIGPAAASEKIDREIATGAEVLLPAGILLVTGAEPEEVLYGAGIEFIDADTVSGGLRVRDWRDGDRIIPLGMEQPKLVSDVLTDARIASSARESVCVLCDEEGIIWIVGGRLSNRVKITNKTKRVLKLEYKSG